MLLNKRRLRFVSRNPLQAVPWYSEGLAKIKYGSESEAKKFLEWVFLSAPERFPLYQTLFETGLRIGELIALQRDCLDFLAGTIEVRRTHCKITRSVLPTTKSGHMRTLGMSAGLKATLLKWLGTHQSEFIFPVEALSANPIPTMGTLEQTTVQTHENQNRP